MLSANGGLFAAGDDNPTLSDPAINGDPILVTIPSATEATIDLTRSNLERSPRYGSYNIERPISIESLGAPEHGTVEVSSNGMLVIYTPDQDFVGYDSFTFEYEVDRSVFEGKVAINVVDPIVAVPDWFRVEQGQREVTLKVTENDGLNFDQPEQYAHRRYVDLAVLAVSRVQITSVGELSHGGTATISEDGKDLVYTPAEGFIGLETVSYTIENSRGHSASGVVDLRVTAPGDYDTSQYTQWWKHQTIHASLDNSLFGLGWIDGSDGHQLVRGRIDSLAQTNTRVSGVEEADFVKTDGERLYVIQDDSSGSRLLIFDIRDPSALTILSETEIEGQPLDLFLHDQSIVVMSQKENGVELISLDVSDSNSPVVDSISLMPGNYRQTRVVDGTIQVYTDGEFGVVPIQFASESDKFLETRKQLIDRILQKHEESQLPIPAVVTSDADGTTRSSAPLLPHVEIVEDQSPFPWNRSLLAIGVFEMAETESDSSEQSTAEPSNGLRVASQRVLGSAADLTIYSTDSSVYLLNTTALPLIDVWNRLQTIVNRFDLNESASDMVWVAKGMFEGRLASSSLVGHHNDLLYAASSNEWYNSALRVLQTNGDRIEEIGQSEALGPGESIDSAWFVEDTAYLVSSNRIDPFFVVDLSEPTAPRVLGDLNVPGYSRYLQQVQDGLLVGVGYDNIGWRGVDSELQISLLDVSDSGEPKLAGTIVLNHHASPIARTRSDLLDSRWERSDHRAFNYFDSHEMLALPVYYQGPRSSSVTIDQSKVLLIKVDADSKEFRVAGEIAFADSRVLRTLRVSDVLYSVSQSEIQAHDLNNPATPLGRIRFEASELTSQRTPVQPTNSAKTKVWPFSYDGIAVEIKPSFVDSDGAVVSSIDPGETVWLEVTADDVRPQNLFVYAAYFAIDFGDAEFEFAGESEFSDVFWVERNDPKDGLHRVGASQELGYESNPDHPWVVRMPVQFSRAGQVQVTLNAATDVKDVVRLLGIKSDIPFENIEFGKATINVIGDPMDVNRDGQISVLDPLKVINRLFALQAGTLPEDFDVNRYDVNGDGEMTPNDALVLINRIAVDRIRAQAIIEVVNEDDDEPNLHTVSESLLF